MHGEYKVPGGKLVVVDLDTIDGRITDFRLAGDFFLEPDEALPMINAAVNGLPQESDATTIAAAVRAALPEGATLLGFTPEAVAIAVRRSLAKATAWRDYDWKIIHSKAVSPVMHMALDEVLANEVGEGRRQGQVPGHLGGRGRPRRRRRRQLRARQLRRRRAVGVGAGVGAGAVQEIARKARARGAPVARRRRRGGV